jgi:glycosyltransferase involved in cell wall biosynthesis
MKIVYIISDVDRSVSFEWIAEKFRNDSDISLYFIFLVPQSSYSAEYIKSIDYNVFNIKLKNKLDWPLAFFSISKILFNIKPDIVHCHLLHANILGLSSAKLLNIPTRIYTRHHSTFHHKYNSKGVLWDNLSNYLASKIVSISPVVTRVLTDLEFVNQKKIFYIPHGFKLNSFINVDINRKNLFRTRHNLPSNKIIIGVVSRFVDWKGLQYIVPAFAEVFYKNKNVHLLLMNAFGSYENEIKRLLRNLPNNSYTLVKFENDMPSAYACMNIFIHAPIDPEVEAFGQIYVEALASGIPSIFTLSGISTEFVKHEENALVVPFRDTQALISTIQKLIKDDKLRLRLMNHASTDIFEKFSLSRMTESLRTLYLNKF